MLKKLLIGSMVLIIVVAGVASTYGVLAAPSTDEIQPLTTDNLSVETAPAGSEISAPQVDSYSHTMVTSQVTAEESVGLVFMYEEEKLARDVYTQLFNLWGQTTFQSIASSEQMHMDAIKTLLVNFGIATPELDAGKFSSPELQSLHDSLVSKGSLSVGEALKVGAEIEEIDILDLQVQINQTTNPDLLMVYNNLMMGSHNHLRSFTSVLTRLTGEVYQPQYLSLDLYESILSSAMGNGTAGGRTGDGTSGTAGSGGKGYRGGR